MDNKNDIENELLLLSPFLAGISKNNVFEVPTGYFENVAIPVFDDAVDLAVLSTIPKPSLQDVPTGYFDQLPISILDRINRSTSIQTGEEEFELSPLLQRIKYNNVFEIPLDYFEVLALNILDKVKLSFQPARIIPMPRRRVLLKFAAAAIITGIMALGVYKYTNNPGNNRLKTDNAFTASTLDPIIEKGKKMDNKQYNDALNNLTEEDIAKYLEKNNDETDLAVLTSNIEENNLPQQEDYLSDDKTLQNYLDEVNGKNTNN